MHCHMCLRDKFFICLLGALLLAGCSSLKTGFLGFAPLGDKQEYVRARNLYNHQQYKEAINQLTHYIYKAGNVSRREARAYRLLGMSYEQLEQLDKALETYLEALEFHPKNVPLLIAAAELYQRTGLTDKSQELFERALKQEPNNLQALAGQAENYRSFGFFSQARNYYDQFFALNPGAPSHYRAKYASTFLNQSNFEQAFIHITMALDKDPHQADYWLISAKASFRLGRYEDALAAIDIALALAPNRPDFKLYKIIGLYQTQHFKESAKLSVQFTQQYPEHQLGWLLLALNEQKLNKYTAARTHLHKAAALNEASFTGKVAAQLLQLWK